MKAGLIVSRYVGLAQSSRDARFAIMAKIA
jgi:hypothetical protein